MRQHWVPQSYLFPWCDPDSPVGQESYVWIFDRDRRTGAKRAPKNIFWERHMYSDLSKPAPDRFRLERGLSKLERGFSELRERKLRGRKRLSAGDKGILVAFTAVMHGRTRAQRDHQREQWGRIFERAEDLQAAVRRMTPEERRRIPSPLSSDSTDPSLSLAQVRAMAEQPMSHVFPAIAAAEAKILAKMNCALVTTESEPGFITSDTPAVHFDPESYKRPPQFRGGMGSRTAEVTLPLTPHLLVLFGWKLDYDREYADLGTDWVDEFNRRTRFHCDQQYVVRRNVTKDHWFEPGEIPDDAWKPQQARTVDQI
jgi:hypothetical protein